jgi:RHS repeat-associated protein
VWHENDGDHAYDALGNSTLMQTREVTRLQGAPNPVSDETNGGRATYQPRTGRQLTHETGAGPKGGKTDFHYDSAGNQDHQLSTSGTTSVTRTDRVLYYGADNVLRAVERRTVTGLEGGQGSFEEYRYDALGRRIWVRTRNWCDSQIQDGRCFFHTQERTVWDGDQALYEIQMSDSERENDTIPSHLARIGNNTYDPNPRVGRVLLTHGPGIDQPLSVIRMGYREWQDQPSPWNTFAVIPLWNTEGRAPYMLFSNGARNLPPSFAPGGARQLKTLWNLGRNAYGPSNNSVVLPSEGPDVVWMGGVIADQQDASGLLYRRNRYYDPQTGRFTQEDPIGLAGGLNAYGFANGDPVSYSDPYGLDPILNADPDPARRARIQAMFSLAWQNSPTFRRAARAMIQDPRVHHRIVSSYSGLGDCSAQSCTMSKALDEGRGYSQTTIAGLGTGSILGAEDFESFVHEFVHAAGVCVRSRGTTMDPVSRTTRPKSWARYDDLKAANALRKRLVRGSRNDLLPPSGV